MHRSRAPIIYILAGLLYTAIADSTEVTGLRSGLAGTIAGPSACICEEQACSYEHEALPACYPHLTQGQHAQAHGHSTQQLARRLLAAEPAHRLCDELPFLPALCWHKLRAPPRFPARTKHAYATLCDYPTLSLGDREARQCLLLAVSVLLSIPRQGFILMLPHGATIEPDYAALLEAMRVRVERFAPIDIPEAAKASAQSIDRASWIPSYQKLNLWRLGGVERVLYIDCDSIVLRNLDHVFLEPDSVGCDCMLHYAGTSEDWVMGYGIGGLLLATPAPETFEKLVGALHAGFDSETGKWAYGGGDQELITKTLPLRLFPANLQLFVEVCQRSADPLLNFPLDNMYIVHFAGLPKGYEMQLRLPAGPEEVCHNQFVHLYEFFDYEVNATLQYHRLHQRGARLRLASARAAQDTTDS